jgi:hypothetical protein
LYAYTAEPIGEGVWMQNKENIRRNCVVQRVTLKRIVLLVLSHHGILTNNSADNSAMTHDATIVWLSINYMEEEKCKLKKIHGGNGIKTGG